MQHFLGLQIDTENMFLEALSEFRKDARKLLFEIEYQIRMKEIFQNRKDKNDMNKTF